MSLLCVVTLCALVAMANASQDTRHYDLNNAREYFEQFIKDFNRVYKDDEDKEAHFHAFAQNLDKINKLNASNSTATFGINKFADFTDEDRAKMFPKIPHKDSTNVVPERVAVSNRISVLSINNVLQAICLFIVTGIMI